jgi:hypothetical protein
MACVCVRVKSMGAFIYPSDAMTGPLPYRIEDNFVTSISTDSAASHFITFPIRNDFIKNQC